MSASDATRSGSPRASSAATRPPIECPARWARSTPWASRNPRTASTRSDASPPPTCFAEPPWPGRSSAYTTRSLDSGSAVNSQLFRSPPKPCRSTSGSASLSPWRRKRRVSPPTVTVSGSAPPASSASPGTNVASKSAMNASTSASSTAASAITPSSPPTAITSPSAASRRRSTPAGGDAPTPLSFSFSPSAPWSPTATSVPTSTSQPTSRPSVMDRPHFGMPSFWTSVLIARTSVRGSRLPGSSTDALSCGGGGAGGRAHRLGDGRRRRHVRVLEDGGERHRRVRRRHHPRRRLELAERLLGDERDDVRREAAARAGLAGADAPPGVLDALEERVGVERRRRRRVDDLALDPLAGQLRGRLLGEGHHPPERDDRHVAALADDVRLGERDRVRLLRHVALDRVEGLVLEEDDRVVVADRLDQEALGVVRVRRHDDLQPGDVGEDRIQRLRVLRRRADARAVHRSDDHRRHGLAAEHVAELRGLVEDLVQADAHEVDEHELRDRAQARGGRAGRRAHDRRLADRRVEDAVGEPRVEALGDAEHAAPGVVVARRAGAADDVLAEDDDRLVALHLLPERLVDRLLEGDVPSHGRSS